jgi:hypothetical protein
VGGLKNVLAGWAKTRKSQKVTTSHDDSLVGVVKKYIPRKLALMVRSPANVFAMQRKDCGQEQDSLRME